MHLQQRISKMDAEIKVRTVFSTSHIGLTSTPCAETFVDNNNTAMHFTTPMLNLNRSQLVPLGFSIMWPCAGAILRRMIRFLIFIPKFIIHFLFFSECLLIFYCY